MNKIILGVALALLLTGSAGAQDAAAPQTAAEALPIGDAAAGQTIFKRCAACHAVGEGARNKVGPQLNGVVGRVAGGLEGYNYSKPMQAAGQNGVIWVEETLSPYLEAPKAYVPGTKMAFPGLKDAQQRADVIAYLRTFSPDAPAIGTTAVPAAQGAAAQ